MLPASELDINAVAKYEEDTSVGERLKKLGEHLHPTMGGGSVSLSFKEDSSGHGFMSYYHKYLFPSWFKMILVWSLSTGIIITPAYLGIKFNLHTDLDVSHFYHYVPYAQSHVYTELLRLTIMCEIICTGIIFARYSSVFVPTMISFFVKRSRQLVSETGASYLELISVLWHQICYNSFALILWLSSFALLDYPPIAADSYGRRAEVEYWSLLPWQFYTERLLFLGLILFTMITVEKAIVHSIAKSFNRSLYYDRVSKCLQSLWAIEALRKAALALNFDRESKFVNWKPLSYPFPRKELNAFFILENFFHLGKDCGDRKRAFSRRLYAFLTPTDRPDELRIEDIQRYIHKGDVARVFDVLDLTHTGEVSEEEFVKAVNMIYEERSTLIQVLMTNSDVIASLDRFLMVIITIIMFVISFPVVGFSPTEAFIPLGVSLTPTIVACTLIFGDTIKSMVAALVFLLASHPYDVGDRVYMDKSAFFVRRIYLLSTTFERWDGFTVYYPNSVLASKEICNVRRTGQQSQRVELVLPASTPTATLHELEQKITNFVNKEMADFAGIRACFYELREMNNLAMVISLRHRHNFQLARPLMFRNNKFMMFLEQAVHDLGITYYTTIRGVELLAPQELHDNK